MLQSILLLLASPFLVGVPIIIFVVEDLLWILFGRKRDVVPVPVRTGSASW